MSTTQAPLNDYLVVDLTGGIAGAYATKILADGGAEVVKVEPPQGDPLRTWSASNSVEPGADGALFSYLSCSKRSVVVDLGTDADVAALHTLLTAAHAVIHSADSPFAGTAAYSPAALLAAHPHLVVTALTPFGLDGPWSDRPATEFTLQAWSGGIIGLGRGAPDRAPVHVGGQIGEWFAGAYASALTLAALRNARRSGVGEILDISKLETEIQGLTYHSVSFLEMRDRPFRSERSIFVPGVAQASDGMVALGCATAQQWFDLCIMVGHPEWIDEDQPLAITTRAFELAPQIYAWIAERTVEEVCEAATTFRIPNAPVGNGANLTGMSHYDERGSFVKNPAQGFSQPNLPYRMTSFDLTTPEPAPALGEHTDDYRNRAAATVGANIGRHEASLPFAGMRVLDMTAFWAGPSCTHILAALGAEVIHLESTTRPDGTRMIAGVPMTDELWWEKSPIFSGLNTNKKSVTINFQTERGQEVLRELIKSCDVLVENYTPRVLDQIGLDYESVKQLRPDIIMVRMPGFGLDGPWRDKAAFAYVIEDASGITTLTGHPDQNPVEPYSIGDPNAGIHALNGLLIALAHRDRTGEGTLVEAAMVDAALNVAAEQVIEYSAYGRLLSRDGNRGPAAAPQNLYQAAGIDEFGRDDNWVAIAVATDDQWRQLVEAIGSPEWATEPDLSTAEGRRRAHDRIDAELANWTRELDSDKIVEILWAAGVPVAKVMQPHRQTEIPQLQARGFFTQVDHPVNGVASHSTLPVVFSSQPDLTFGPAPLLGQHNTEVLAGIGLDPAQIEQLENDKIIGQALAF
ncbi:CoA transferase [Gordonia sp. ABSL1-1]|uniref:CaiB/BaiF CoA transferase family protein n=1 Tax=Gordonia sp. ABSL1-1 TaxID=3053923 RepID=UPI002572EDB4|nr:CoA transferase [Gordonia sp. ABSL1-1]MDL9938111.1 CoA transferase [Gordonia sp. ABSL1-1]